MNDKYIDISSGFRNRSQFPLPSYFEIMFSDCGNRNTLSTARDPYSSASAIFPPINLADGDSFSSQFYLYDVVGLNNTYQIDGVVVNGETLINPEEVDNFYVGQTIEVGSETRTITGYSAIPTDTTFYNGTESGAFVSTTTNIRLTAPFSDIDDYYVGKTITINGETRPIVDYDGTTGEVIVAPPLSSIPPDTTPITITGSTYYVQLDSDFSPTITTVIPATTGSNTLARIRGSTPPEYGSITTTATPTTTLPIGTGLSDIYTGNFIHLWDATTSQYVQVTAYDPTSGDLTITPPFTGPAALYSYAVIPFSGDNSKSLNYTGSRVSNQQATCHEISLVSLTLPNLLLKSGGKIAFKPYVYVEMTNLTNRTNNHIWSNNPNANHALFKVSVNDDISEPSENPFVTLLCQCMTQTINFKPNDNFRFAVRLPSGELFEVSESETFSPSPPNPDIQIDALFKIRKVC